MQVNKFVAAVALTTALASIPLASLADRKDEGKMGGREVVRNAQVNAEANHIEKERSHDAALRDIEIKHAASENRNLDKKINHDEALRRIEEKHVESADRHGDARMNHDAAVRDVEIKHAESATRGVEKHDDHHGDHH